MSMPQWGVALEAGDTAKFVALLQSGDFAPDAVYRGPTMCQTALGCALDNGNVEAVKALLRAGANPNLTCRTTVRRDGYYELPLTLAAMVDTNNEVSSSARPPAVSFVQLLLDAGADPAERNSHGETWEDRAGSIRARGREGFVEVEAQIAEAIKKQLQDNPALVQSFLAAADKDAWADEQIASLRAREKDKRTCAWCGQSNSHLKLCSGCRAVYYCSDECHHAGWQSHRSACRTRK